MTLLKTTSYAVMHMVVAILVAYAWSRSWVIALGIGLIEPCVQTVAFFFHEMAWHRWGGRDAHNEVIDSTGPLNRPAESVLRRMAKGPGDP
ncbi:MAG TPA: hypothetical protein DDX54_06495 [Rhodospirillaceae bacterium]|nr:DUF2061 domain-containing protein [Alphaproteobacteria bacterium]HBH27032.1 hypothetical protein [Rhodospirillaceae bacterium]